MESMSESGGKDVELLLLRLGEFGAFVSKALAEAAGADVDVSNVSVLLLCRLDIEGPMRPNQITDLEHMTSGGVSKLIDRMESDGLVERRRGVLATDHRAVLVVITRKGRDVVRRMAEVIRERLGETEIVIKEINQLLETGP